MTYGWYPTSTESKSSFVSGTYTVVFVRRCAIPFSTPDTRTSSPSRLWFETHWNRTVYLGGVSVLLLYVGEHHDVLLSLYFSRSVCWDYVYTTMLLYGTGILTCNLSKVTNDCICRNNTRRKKRIIIKKSLTKSSHTVTSFYYNIHYNTE